MSVLCIPDTSSILFATKVELAGSKLIHLLDREFYLVLCEKVKEECIRKTRTTERKIKEEVDRFLDNKKEDIFYSYKYEKCLEVVQKWFRKKNMQKFDALGEGEKHCVALTLYLNRIKNKKIILLIDDFRAVISLIELFLGEQKVGIVESTPDFIIHFYNTNKVIGHNHVLAALRDYFSISPNAVYEKIFDERLKLSCRVLGFDICRVQCLFR